MTPTHPPTTTRRTRFLLAALTITAAAVATVGRSSPADALGDNDWLGIVNAYRASSGLAPVGENPTWSQQGRDHSCYMLLNGIAHDEIPGRPGYTAGGDIAGNSGNVAVSSAFEATARNHIDLWMTGPFHAIGILRHNLTTSGFGLCARQDTPTPWRSGGTLDVIRGIDGSRARPTTPTLFPGDGATVPLNKFITEFPNPVTLCGWQGEAGLPLIAMMPTDVTAANSTLSGPNGPVQTCTLHKGNTGGDATAQAILDGDNAVVVMPRTVLADGVYTATVNSNGGNVTWSFTIDSDGEILPPEPPGTSPSADDTPFEPVTPFRLVDSRIGQGTQRLRAGRITRLTVADPDVAAVSANFTVVRPAGNGYVTVYNCTPTLPTVSTLTYRTGQNVANQAIVPLDSGQLCLYAFTDTDLIVDINGYYRASNSGAGFTPTTPARLLDTRKPGASALAPMQQRRLTVVGVPGGAPAGADGVALNVTAVRPGAPGWLRVYPCEGSTSDVSSVNFVAGDIRPNTVVVPVSSDGTVCLLSSAPTNVLVDITGFFQNSGGADFVPLEPIRLVDTRTPGGFLNAFTAGARVSRGRTLTVPVAGARGIPGDAEAVSVNITAVRSDTATFVTAYPCGTRPDTSNLNLLPSQGAAANGAMVKLSASGNLCVYVAEPAHVIIDINGVWR